MKKTYALLLAVCVLALGFSSETFADKKLKVRKKADTRKVAANTSHELLYYLPSSDAVVSMNANRFFSEAMPQVLASNQPRLTQINQMLDDVKSKIGIDLKTFEKLAVGVNIIRPKQSNSIDFAPVVLARGKDVNAGSYLAAARLATNGKFREEKYANRTIYIFAIKDLTAKLPTAKNVPPTGFEILPETKQTEVIGMATSLIGNEIAITDFDENTLAIGDLARVKETLNGKNRVTDELLQAATKSPNSIMSFAGNMPAEMSKIIGIEDAGVAELIKTIDTIRQISGFMEMTAEGGANINLVAKTAQLDQAKQLEETLSFLQSFGANMLGNKKDEMNKIYVRTIQNAKITRTINEVQLNAAVLPADVQKLGSKL